MAHTYTARTAVLTDGMIGGWYTVDNTEVWAGFFKDQRLANYALNAMMNSARARYGDPPAAADPA